MKKQVSEEKLEELLVNFTEDLTSDPETLKKMTDAEIVSLAGGEGETASLLRAARTLSSVIQPKKPSAEFSARLMTAVQERFQDQMSKQKIQKIIGMAVTVEEFRKSLFTDIVSACRGIGLELTPKELAALKDLKEDAVNQFANSLDERITKFFTGSI